MHYKTSARSSKWQIGVHDFEYESVIIVVSEIWTPQNVIIVQTFGPEGAMGRSSREKKRGLEITCAPHLSERSILSPKRFKLKRRGG